MKPFPDEMAAVGFDAPGGPDVLRIERMAVPRPGRAKF